MSKITIDLLANAYNEKLWSNFEQCFPRIKQKTSVMMGIPDDILAALVAILGENSIEQWLNTELKLLDNNKAIDLMKSEKDIKALKMFILSMPN